MVFLAEFDHQNVIEGGDRAGPWPTGHLLILRRLCNAILVSLGRVAVGKTAVIPQHYTGAHKKVISEITIMASVRRGW